MHTFTTVTYILVWNNKLKFSGHSIVVLCMLASVVTKVCPKFEGGSFHDTSNIVSSSCLQCNITFMYARKKHELIQSFGSPHVIS